MAKVKSKKTVKVKKAPAKKTVKSSAKKKTPVKKAAPKKKATKTTVSKSKAKTKRKGETLECFLTTACVQYYALPDNGYELTTLRYFRDHYLASSAGGKELIQEYYQVSPKIVTRVNEDADKKNIYTFIYSKVVEACAAIEEKKLRSAKEVYVGLVRTLMKRYNMH